MKYYSSVTKNSDFSTTLEKLTSELTKEGFGIVSELDVKKKFKEKLNIDYSNYLILGVCQPQFAYLALEEEPHVGVFLPCNIVLRELNSKKIEVFAIDPVATISTLKITKLDEVANTIREKLNTVLQRIQ